MIRECLNRLAAATLMITVGWLALTLFFAMPSQHDFAVATVRAAIFIANLVFLFVAAVALVGAAGIILQGDDF